MFFRMVYKSGQIYLPFCHNTRVWQTDGQTDRILIAIPRLHYMQRGKNWSKSGCVWMYCMLPYSENFLHIISRNVLTPKTPR